MLFRDKVDAETKMETYIMFTQLDSSGFSSVNNELMGNAKGRKPIMYIQG
jgi:hypothetical protein